MKKILATILISAVAFSSGFAASTKVQVTVTQDRGLIIELNGEKQNLVDGSGATVYPLVYKGSTYVPLKAVSSMLGAEVDFDAKANKVILKSGEAAENSAPNLDSKTAGAIDIGEFPIFAEGQPDLGRYHYSANFKAINLKSGGVKLNTGDTTMGALFYVTDGSAGLYTKYTDYYTNNLYSSFKGTIARTDEFKSYSGEMNVTIKDAVTGKVLVDEIKVGPSSLPVEIEADLKGVKVVRVEVKGLPLSGAIVTGKFIK